MNLGIISQVHKIADLTKELWLVDCGENDLMNVSIWCVLPAKYTAKINNTLKNNVVCETFVLGMSQSFMQFYSACLSDVQTTKVNVCFCTEVNKFDLCDSLTPSSNIHQYSKGRSLYNIQKVQEMCNSVVQRLAIAHQAKLNVVPGFLSSTFQKDSLIN